MSSINYFQFICFLWAAIGIISRIAMAVMGEKWDDWELKSAYGSKKPAWINIVGIIGYGMVGFTWYKWFTTDIAYSWVIAVLVSLTVVKISTLLFNYQAFRQFLKITLNNKKKMLYLNVSVVIFSLVLVWMGVHLY